MYFRHKTIGKFKKNSKKVIFANSFTHNWVIIRNFAEERTGTKTKNESENENNERA